MVTDTDVYHSAKLIIDQYGGDAEIYASMRADELLEAGDLNRKICYIKGTDDNGFS